MNRVKINGVDKYVYHEVLNNGLNIYLMPEGFKNFHISITCKYGSSYLNFKEKGKLEKLKVGCAHALEHQMYKKENTNIFNEFESLGAKANAYTSFDNTTYEVTHQSDFKKVLNILLDLVFTPYFKEENLKIEKDIIKDEIRTNMLDPFNILDEKINSFVYKYDEKKYLITGSEKDVNKLNSSDLQKAYDFFYHPENMFIVITGGFKKIEALAIIKEYFKDKVFSKYNKITKITKNEPLKLQKGIISLKSNINIPILSVTYKLNKDLFKKYDDFTLGLYLDAILSLLFGKSSILYNKLYDENIINDLINFNYTINTNNIVLTIIVRTFYTDEIINQIDTSFKNILTNDELNLYKKVSISSYIINFDDIIKTNDLLIDDLINGNINTNYINNINSLNINDLNNIIKLVKNNNKLIISINPLNMSNI